jgi:DTW domain-containing protein YfiP
MAVMPTRTKRGFRIARCEECRMVQRVCVCDLLPRAGASLQNRTRVVVVAHPRELDKPTNTGRFVPRCLARGELVQRGAVEAPSEGSALLFPSGDAKPIDPSSPPITLYVPDGTYRQARRMANRDRFLKDLPRVALPETVRPVGYMRRGARPHHLSTLEAVARALGVLEGRELEAPLLAFVEVMVKRTLWARGALAAVQVPGGIPPLGPPSTDGRQMR